MFGFECIRQSMIPLRSEAIPSGDDAVVATSTHASRRCDRHHLKATLVQTPVLSGQEFPE